MAKLNEALNLLTNDRKRNYDNKNDIHTEDILPRTWRFVRDYDQDGQIVFFEQLIDILGGACSQGRTTRIMQFYTVNMDGGELIKYLR